MCCDEDGDLRNDLRDGDLPRCWDFAVCIEKGGRTCDEGDMMIKEMIVTHLERARTHYSDKGERVDGEGGDAPPLHIER